MPDALLQAHDRCVAGGAGSVDAFRLASWDATFALFLRQGRSWRLPRFMRIAPIPAVRADAR